jgi:hypothetical protein
VFHHVDIFVYRHKDIDPLVERGMYNGHPITSPHLQTFLNTLEDIATMLEIDMTSWRTPPITDNFTQLWLDYFQSQRKDTKRTAKIWKAPDLSIEIILCTDVYMKVQEIFRRADSTTISDDYRLLWRCKNEYMDPEYMNAKGAALNWLEAPIFQDGGRDELKSFFRNEAETKCVDHWLTGDIFWWRRERTRNQITGIGFTSDEQVIFGVFKWDWPRANLFLAGLIGFIVLQAVNELEMVVQNTVGSTLAYAHLYNYLRCCKDTSKPSKVLLQKEWTDMGSFFRIVCDRSIFRAERSKALEHRYMRATLSHGTPLAGLAISKRNDKTTVKSQGTLHFGSILIIDALFKNGTKGRNFLDILSKSNQKLLIGEANVHIRSCAPDHGGLKPHNIAGADIYLSIFRHTLQSEIPRLHYMHGRLGRQALELNDELMDRLRPAFEAPGAPILIPTEIENPLAPLNFMWYERSFYVDASGGMDSDMRTVYTKPVYDAARVMTEYLHGEKSKIKPSALTERMEKLAGYVFNSNLPSVSVISLLTPNGQFRFTNPLTLSDEDIHRTWMEGIHATDTAVLELEMQIKSNKTLVWTAFRPAFYEFLSCPPAEEDDSAPDATEDGTTATTSGDVSAPGTTATEEMRT